MQRVRARQVDGVACSPSNASGILDVHANSTPSALLVCLCQRPKRPWPAGAVEAAIVQRVRSLVFSFRRDNGIARLNAPKLSGEASGRFPLLVQPLLERVNEALLRDGQQ